MTTADPLHRARQLMRDGHTDSARQQVQAALYTDPNDVRAWGLLVQLADTPEAGLASVQQVLRLKPGDPWALRRKAAFEEAIAAQGSHPTPTMDLPPVPDSPAQVMWEAVRAGTTILVCADASRVRRTVLDGLAHSLDEQAITVRSLDEASRHHRLIVLPTLPDDDMLDLLVWADRAEVQLLVGMAAQTVRQAVQRYQFAAQMALRRSPGLDTNAVPALFWRVFGLILVAEADEADEIVIREVAHITPEGLVQVYPPEQPAPPPPDEPARPDLSHHVLTRASTPPVYDEPGDSLRPPPFSGMDATRRQRIGLGLLAFSIIGILLVVMVTVLALLEWGVF